MYYYISLNDKTVARVSSILAILHSDQRLLIVVDIDLSLRPLARVDFSLEQDVELAV